MTTCRPTGPHCTDFKRDFQIKEQTVRYNLKWVHTPTLGAQRRYYSPVVILLKYWKKYVIKETTLKQMSHETIRS